MRAPAVPIPNCDGRACKPDYLRGLIESAQLSQSEVADRIGVTLRTMGRYLAGTTRIPYPVQFTVECLVAHHLSLRPSRRDLTDMDAATLLRYRDRLTRAARSSTAPSLEYLRLHDQLSTVNAVLAKRSSLSTSKV